MSTLPFIPTQQLLQTKTSAHPFSDVFADFCRQQCWFTIQDILEIPLKQLLEIPNYRQQCHGELRTFLYAHRRHYLFKISR